MARKRYKPEEIVAKLRQVDVLVSQGQTMVDAIRQIGVSEVTYYRWRQEFGGLKSEQVKRLKDCRRPGRARAGCRWHHPSRAGRLRDRLLTRLPGIARAPGIPKSHIRTFIAAEHPSLPRCELTR